MYHKWLPYQEMNIMWNYKLSFWEEVSIFRLCTPALEDSRASHHIRLASWHSISNYNWIQLSASGVAPLGSGLCKALYSFQARQDDELNLEKGKNHFQIVWLPYHVVIFHLNKNSCLCYNSLTSYHTIKSSQVYNHPFSKIKISTPKIKVI